MQNSPWRIPHSRDVWEVGDRFRLRYANSHRFKHRFYSGPSPGQDPTGVQSRKIPRSEVYIPHNAPYTILELNVFNLDDSIYLSARFNYNGQDIWTALYKDEHAWAFRSPPGPSLLGRERLN